MADEWDGTERRGAHWHVAREIPIAVLVTLIIQTGTGVWFLASLSAKVDSALDSLKEFRLERYTKADAERDRALMQQSFMTIQSSHVEMNRRLDKLEALAHPEESHPVGRLNR